MMPLALAAFLAASSPVAGAAKASVGEQRQWIWRSGHALRPLTVRIVRGSYRIVRRPGPAVVSMSVFSPGGDPEAVHFSVDAGKSVTITDVYPRAALRSWKECLPPHDARGDFWASDALIEAVIEAPLSLPVTVEVMDLRRTEGSVHRSSSQFELIGTK